MMCTGHQFGDFFVRSPNENDRHVERILLNFSTRNILESSELFFYNVLLPKLLGKAYTNAICNTDNSTDI